MVCRFLPFVFLAPILFAQQEMPVKFHDQLILLTADLGEGQSLEFYTDTGGGIFVLRSAAERLKLKMETLENKATFATMPKSQNLAPGLPNRFYVLQDPEDSKQKKGDGMLGQAWFGDRIWTFDYPGQRLIYHEESPSFPDIQAVPLGFKTNDAGERLTHFPSIEAKIDGRDLPFLFDTGARIILKDKAYEQIGDSGPRYRAVSFITANVFDQWRQAHPDWRVIEDADEAVADGHLIQVPEIEIGGHKVGPVWFVCREDTNFHDYMSGMMDRRVEGALGGTLFKFFKITVDYPAAKAYFQR